jgi:hypothetical protein
LSTEASKPGRHRKKRLLRVVQIVVSLGVVLGIFAGILPKIADYSAVWATIRSLTWFELLSLFAITTLHSMAVWPQMVASLPGLTLAQAAVNNQASTTVANALPGGGMLAVGVSYAMCRSWGFADSSIALSTPGSRSRRARPRSPSCFPFPGWPGGPALRRIKHRLGDGGPVIARSLPI